jgi:hypothetical protein
MAVGGLLLTGAGLQPQSSLQDLLNDTALPGTWVYDDIQGAHAQARASGKPLLFLFR